MRKTSRLFLIIPMMIAILSAGCSPSIKEGEVIATVNGAPIYLEELRRELSIRAKQNPSLEVNETTLNDLLDNMIKRQLLIQEAMKKKMAQEQRFVNTIKSFWEQTLIRDFVDYKNSEFDRYIFVTDKEISDYYEDLKKKEVNLPPLEDVYDGIKAMIGQEKRSQALADWLKTKKETSKISVNKKIISRMAPK